MIGDIRKVYLPFGRYVPGESSIHRLDPRVKLLGMVVLVITTLLTEDWIALVAVAVTVLIMTICARMSVRELWRDIWMMRLLYIVTIVLHSVLTPGEALVRLPFELAITLNGIWRGLFFSIKIGMLTTFMGMLMRTTHPASWMQLLNLSIGRRGFLGRMIAPAALTMGISIRFLPLILEEAERIRWAQLSRGLDIEGGLIRKVRSLKPLLIPMISASFSRVDLITTAMQSRGFRLGQTRTIYRRSRLGPNDAAALATVILLAGIVLI